ncbi:MAG: hypothetical protein U5L74_02595 [Ideonella sp.]|nr:hypothetical protein [Ideonella sp.]
MSQRARSLAPVPSTPPRPKATAWAAPHRPMPHTSAGAALEPCLVVVRRTMSRTGVITLARLVHPGRRYLLEGQFEP